MAAGAGGLAQADVEARVAEARAKGLIPALQFSAIAEDGTILWKSQAYVVRYRAGGFMFLVPGEADVVEFFEMAGPFDFYAHHQTTVQVETARGRALGSVDVVLVDCPWAALQFFRKMPSLRGEAALAMVKFVHDGVTCRPSREGALFAAEAWIAENMDEEAADEYVSCEEAYVAGEAVGGGEGLGQVHSVEQLQAHIQDLELQLAALTQHQTGSAPARPLQQAQGLLGAVPKAPGVPAQTMERLRSLAGAGPTRLGGHEKRDRALELTPNGADVFETLQQEQELEAGDGDELAQMTADAFQDPMHKLLFLQMQQVTLLQKQVAARQPQDAIHAALSSGSDPSSSTSSGIKGCLAREAFLKISDNLVSIAQVVETNALMELGLSPAQLSPGLLRDYLEKRVPLGSFRLLTQMGYMMASAYETGQRTGNRELAGFGAKGLMFVEQTALDEGKTSLSWLLTGLPEPNFAQVQSSDDPRSQLCQAVQPAMQSVLGRSQCGLSSRLGFLGEQDSEHRERFQDPCGKSITRCTSTEEALAEEEEQRKGERRRPRRRSGRQLTGAAGRSEMHGIASRSRPLPARSTSAQGASGSTVNSGRGLESRGSASRASARGSSQLHPKPPRKLGARQQQNSCHFPDAKVAGKRVPSEIRCIEMIRAVLRVAGASHTGFGEFVAKVYSLPVTKTAPILGRNYGPVLLLDGIGRPARNCRQRDGGANDGWRPELIACSM